MRISDWSSDVCSSDLKSQTNFEVAKRENQAILLEENYKENYENFDPNSTESYIIFSLYQSQYMERSVSLAAKLQQEFVKLGRRNRGVKDRKSTRLNSSH